MIHGTSKGDTEVKVKKVPAKKGIGKLFKDLKEKVLDEPPVYIINTPMSFFHGSTVGDETPRE